MRPFDRTKRHDEWQVSRWTHPPAKRSGRYTKPGYRPRAGRKADYLAARQKIRNETLVEKADRAMRSIYNTAPTGETSIIVNSGFLNYTNPFLNETTGGDYLPTIGDVNPRIYLPGRTEATFTTSTNVTYNTPLYLGVDHGVTDSTTSWTISTGNNLSVQAWPQRVSYDEDGNQEVTWLTESVRAWQDMGRAAAQAGQAMGGVVDAFRDAANAVGNAGTAFTNQFRIVVNPNMPPDQIAWTYGQDYVFADVPLSRRQRLRQQMQPQRDPCRADGVSFQNCSPAEITALTLLKKMGPVARARVEPPGQEGRRAVRRSVRARLDASDRRGHRSHDHG